MIKINLISEKRKKKSPQLSTVLISGAAILIITILILGALTFHLLIKISDMKNEKAAKEKTLNELLILLKEVENYEKDNESYRKKNEIIERLKKNQNVPLRLLDEVSAQLPLGVWLTSLTDKGGNVDVVGYAFTNSDVVGYVQDLKSSKYLANVSLLESQQVALGNVSLYQFKLTFKVKDVDILSTS